MLFYCLLRIDFNTLLKANYSFLKSCYPPNLFLIYVNDLPNFILHCKCLLYADDTTIFIALTKA